MIEEKTEVPNEYVSPFSRAMRDRREAEQAKTHHVYFLYSCNLIKIGTSRDYVRRIVGDIAPYSAAPISILKVIPGGKILEGRLHSRFEAAHAQDEWFDLSPELRTYLNEDERTSEALAGAEESYRDWLKEELAYQEKINV